MDKDYAKVPTLIFRPWATCGWSKGLYFKSIDGMRIFLWTDDAYHFSGH